MQPKSRTTPLFVSYLLHNNRPSTDTHGKLENTCCNTFFFFGCRLSLFAVSSPLLVRVCVRVSCVCVCGDRQTGEGDPNKGAYQRQGRVLEQAGVVSSLFSTSCSSEYNGGHHIRWGQPCLPLPRQGECELSIKALGGRSLLLLLHPCWQYQQWWWWPWHGDSDKPLR